MRRAPVRARLTLAVLLGLTTFPGMVRAEKPETQYQLHCQACHLADGRGTSGSVPQLAGEVGKFLLVEGGREFLVRVPGSSLSPLSDADLATLLNWIVNRFGPAEVAAHFEPYTEAYVSSVRRPPLVDVVGVRAGLMQKIAGLAAAPKRAASPARRD